MVSAELITKVAYWREKARTGELSMDEMRDAISFLRAEREATPPPSARKKVEVDGDKVTEDLFKDLGL